MIEQKTRVDPLPLFLHWTGFLKWTLNKTSKFPRNVRFTLALRIDNIALDVLESVIAEVRPCSCWTDR